MGRKRLWAATVYTGGRLCEGVARAEDRAIKLEHVWLVRALRLTQAAAPHKLLYCDLVRAVRRWELHLVRSGAKASKEEARKWMRSGVRLTVRERDELGLVQYPDGQRPGAAGGATTATALPTLVGSRFRQLLLGGPAAGGGFYVSNRLLMRWMGLTAASSVGPGQPAGSRRLAAEAERRLSPSALTKAIGDSIPLPLATAVMWAAEEATPGGWGEAPRVGLLYAGAFGGMTAGIREADACRGRRRSVRTVFAAESSRARRRLLYEREGHERTYRSVRQAAAREAEEVDVLIATPPCPTYSVEGILGAKRRSEAEATAETMRTAVSIARVAAATRPATVVVEQVDGLLTHYKGQAGVLKALLATMPYRWRQMRLNAAELGSPFRRKRIALVGVAKRLAAGARRSGCGEAREGKAAPPPRPTQTKA